MTRMSRFWVAASAALMILLISVTHDFAAGNPVALVRQLPYPFSHVVSFSDDADELRPWHGAAMHRVMNEDLGLTISDSLWVSGTDRLSSLFLGPDELNRSPSLVENLPTYALLLREWHRGNIDHFHGWHEDSVYQLRNAFEPPQKLASSTVLALPPVQSFFATQQRHNVRIYFNAEPPADLAVTLVESSGRQLEFPSGRVKHAKDLQLQHTPSAAMVEVLIPNDETAFPPVAINAALIANIELKSPSCSKGCDIAILRVERDDFSRETVQHQLPLLESWNIRPALLTSHGGATLLQDFGVKGKFYEVPRDQGTIFTDPAVVVRRQAEADQKQSHAYHADLLQRLGVAGVWSYFPADPSHYFGPLKSDSKRPLPPLTKTYDGFYNTPRSTVGNYDRTSADTFAHDVAPFVPGLSEPQRQALYCGQKCDSAQGDALGLLVASSLQLIRHGEHVEHFWYTHFGSAGSDFVHTLTEPFTPIVLDWLRQLSNQVYNFDGTVPANQRVWSPPATTWLRYQMLRAHIQEHVTASTDGNKITIQPWRDPVTSQTIPDLHSGTRDLHGLTLYVRSPELARIFVDSTELHTFTRNPPDETGQPSITLIDDNSPTTLIDSVPLADKGDVTMTAGSYTDTRTGPDTPELRRGFISLTADRNGDSKLVFKPSRLDLYNSTHLHLAYRRLTGATKPGQMTISLKMEDGDEVVMREGDAPPFSASTASQWLIPEAGISTNWKHITLDTAQLSWPEIHATNTGWSRPPLPIGRVKSITLSLENAAPGTILDLGDLEILRPMGNGGAPDQRKLVAGRVTDPRNIGLPNITVEAHSNSIGLIRTQTDQDGLFAFRRPKGERLAISAKIAGQTCAIQQGRLVEISKDEAEFDINAGECGVKLSAR
jgi:hypothetical protein